MINALGLVCGLLKNRKRFLTGVTSRSSLDKLDQGLQLGLKLKLVPLFAIQL